MGKKNNAYKIAVEEALEKRPLELPRKRDEVFEMDLGATGSEVGRLVALAQDTSSGTFCYYCFKTTDSVTTFLANFLFRTAFFSLFIIKFQFFIGTNARGISNANSNKFRLLMLMHFKSLDLSNLVIRTEGGGCMFCTSCLRSGAIEMIRVVITEITSRT
jgi:hypothetical protein